MNVDHPPGWESYVLAVLFPLLVCIVGVPFMGVLDIANIVMLFLLEVFLCAVWLGKSPSLIAALVSVLLFDLIFVPPYFAVLTTSMDHIVTLVVMLLIALLTGQMTAKLLAQNRALHVSEERVTALYRMASELAGALDLKEVEAVADKYPENDATVSLLSIARQRLQFAEMAHAHELQMESERLRSSILSTLSHDLRTPLTALVGLTETLNTESQALPTMQRDMVEAIHEQSVRLAEMVTKVLDLARLSAGKVNLNKEWQPIDEVIGTALKLLSLTLANRPIRIHIPKDFPLLAFDAVMIERVIGNLLENASKYSPPSTAITVSVTQVGDMAEVRICDSGQGFPSHIVSAQVNLGDSGCNYGERSSGLGLAICTAILKAHDGQLRLLPNPNGVGGCACFMLPLGTPPTMDDELDEDEISS